MYKTVLYHFDLCGEYNKILILYVEYRKRMILPIGMYQAKWFNSTGMQ